MKVKVLLSHVRLFAIPWIVACQAPLSMEFSRKEYWSGLPFPSPGHLPNSGIKSESLALKEETDRTGSILKAGLHLGPDCGL